jgi:hypothetical protein
VKYVVILKSLRAVDEQIVLGEAINQKHAEQIQKGWRRVLGGKNWQINRRPGLDTLDHLALTIERREET